MGISVAEYMGLRSDIKKPLITPVTHPATCPFMASNCEKLSRKNKPICSLRKNDGTLYINCSRRLCSTKANVPLSLYQKNILHQVAKTIFTPNISLNDILIKREVDMKVTEQSDYHADFIMMTDMNGFTSSHRGPNKVILEMQGGGETSNTGIMTEHIKLWENDKARTNALLAKDMQKMGTLETNAWRRQQEQFIVKGNIAMQTTVGCAIAFCVGSTLFDYLFNKVSYAHLGNLKDYNWTLALIGISEDLSSPKASGSIPLVVDGTRMLFTSYHAFVRALTDQGQPCPELFEDNFERLA